MKWFNSRNEESQDESFERRIAVVESVEKTFKTLGKKNCEGKNFLLWVEDNDTAVLDLSAKNADGLSLEQELVNRLSNKGYNIGKLEIRKGKPDGDPMPCHSDERLKFQMFLEIVSKSMSISPSQSMVMKASITLAPGSLGSLVLPEGYVIDSEHVPYNIGRVIEPGDNTNRINHIGIVDDTHQVSRIHAHIGFAANVFYLQRDKKPGQRPNDRITNRTTITRNEREENLSSLSSKISLKDGDIINLSDCVSLLFTVLK